MLILCCTRAGRLHDLRKHGRVALPNGRPAVHEQTRVGCWRATTSASTTVDHAHALAMTHIAMAHHTRDRCHPHQGAVALRLGRVGVMPLEPPTDNLMRLLGATSLEMHIA